MQTDFVLGEEADELVLVLDDAEARTVSVVGLSALALPLRLDPLTVSPGEHSVGLRLLRRGTRVISRTVVVQVRGPTSVVPIWLLRSCSNVTCPESGATECEDGRCVTPECVPLEGGGCAETGTDGAIPIGVGPACVADADCEALPVACAEAVCSDGRCLAVPLDPGTTGACATVEYCSLATGMCETSVGPVPMLPEEPPVTYGPDVDAGVGGTGSTGSNPSTPVRCCDRICSVGGVVTRCCDP